MGQRGSELELAGAWEDAGAVVVSVVEASEVDPFAEVLDDDAPAPPTIEPPMLNTITSANATAPITAARVFQFVPFMDVPIAQC